MKMRFVAILFCALACSLIANPAFADSTRKERRLINRGNALYKNSKYVEAASAYEQALGENSSSAEALYNLGLANIRRVTNPADTTPANQKLVDTARKSFSSVAALARTKPGLAAKANFNLGNIEFNSKDYAKAIDFYKQALRIDPTDDKARKNLRIAQKNLQKQNQDKNQDQNQNQDQQDQNQQQDQQKNQDQQQNQNQQQNQDQQDKKDQQSQNNLSQQAASQILQAIDNKESATRARVNKANSGEKSRNASRNNRRW